MRGAHRIKVILFKQLDIKEHIFTGKRVPLFRMMLMTVNTTDQQRLTINFKLPVEDLNDTETNLISFTINFLTGTVNK